jgi:hypothetical protein
MVVHARPIEHWDRNIGVLLVASCRASNASEENVSEGSIAAVAQLRTRKAAVSPLSHKAEAESCARRHGWLW